MSFSQIYLDQTTQIANSLDPEIIENIAKGLSTLRERNGRLFFIGSGGGAGHAGAQCSPQSNRIIRISWASARIAS